MRLPYRHISMLFSSGRSLAVVLLLGLALAASVSRAGEPRLSAYLVGLPLGQSPALLELTAEQEDQILNAWRESTAATVELRKKRPPLSAEDRRAIQEAGKQYAARREEILTDQQKALRKVIGDAVAAAQREVAQQEKDTPLPVEKDEIKAQARERIKKLKAMIPYKVDEAVRNYWDTLPAKPKPDPAPVAPAPHEKEAR